MSILDARPKTFAVELPDAEQTVYVLKGTWGLANKLDELSAANAPLPERIAELLANPDGTRLVTTPDDIKKLGDVMTIADMTYVVQRWSEENGVSREQMESRLKNSAASQNGVSASV